VADIQGEDGVQVSWAQTVDAAAELQQADDAAAVAAAIAASDNADAQQAADRAAAWTAEVEGLSGAVTTYDKASAEAARSAAQARASAVHTARDASYAAFVVYAKADADANYNYTVSQDWDQYSSAEAAAAAAVLSADVAASKALAITSASDAETFENALADAKVGGVDDVTTAEDEYVAATATAGATATKADAQAAATMDGGLASDESTFEIDLEGANVTLDGADGTDQEGLVHDEAEADATDETAYGQATANYETSIWNNYAGQLGAIASATAAASSNPAADPAVALANYHAAVAQIEANQTGADGTELVSEEQQIAGEEVSLGDQTETASVDETNAADAAVQSETTTLLPEEVPTPTRRRRIKRRSPRRSPGSTPTKRAFRAPSTMPSPRRKIRWRPRTRRRAPISAWG